MTFFAKLGSAAIVITLLFSSSVFGEDLNANHQDETLKAHSKNKWKSFRFGDLIVRGWNDKLAHARIAFDENGNQLSCFTEKPHKLGIQAKQIGAVKFEGQKFFCLNGRDEIESLARQKRIQIYNNSALRKIAKSTPEQSATCPAVSTVVASNL
jgi:hypothetical protein